MFGQNIVERGAEPGQPSPQVERIDLERQHGIVDRNRRWRPDRGFVGFDVGEL